MPDAFAQDSTGAGIVQYTGWRTPGRMLSVCDYLALDLRTADSDSAGNCSGASGSPTRATPSACWSQTRRCRKQPTPTGCGGRLSVRQQTDGQILQG